MKRPNAPFIEPATADNVTRAVAWLRECDAGADLVKSTGENDLRDRKKTAKPKATQPKKAKEAKKQGGRR